MGTPRAKDAQGKFIKGGSGALPEMPSESSTTAAVTAMNETSGCPYCDLELVPDVIEGLPYHKTKAGLVECKNKDRDQYIRAALVKDHVEIAGAEAGEEPEASADIEVAAAAEVPTHAAGLENPAAYEKAVEEIRARRKIYGVSAQKLALQGRRGYKRHWFNDSAGRIDSAVRNGWGHVVEQGRPVSRVVGVGRDNKPLRAYAMELPLPLWEEDQAVIHKAAQARLDDIKGAGAFRAAQGSAHKSDGDKFYSPREEPVTVSSSIVRG